MCVCSVVLRLLLGKQYNAGAAWGGSWKPRIYYYNSPYSLVCCMSLEGFHVIDSWLLQGHYSRAGVHQTLHHTQVCCLHLSEPVVEAELIPSWQRADRCCLAPGQGEGSCSHAKMEAAPLSTLSWQAQLGSAASRNLCLSVLDVMPLSDVKFWSRSLKKE